MLQNSVIKNIKLSIYIFLLVILVSCKEKINPSPVPPTVADTTFIRAADMSFIPEIESTGTLFKNNGNAEDPLVTLSRAGCNYIRLRLWHTPLDGHSGINEVKYLASRIHQQGMKLWISVHFSDTWADPSNQTKPSAWQNLNFNSLNSAVGNYMSTVATELQPDLIQIGNETNDGFLWPDGKLSVNQAQCLYLMKTAIDTVRNKLPQTKIMLQFGGITGSEWFFGKVQTLNYDYIGISYYPIWHGTNLDNLKNKINYLSQTYQKKVLIAETAYPFTLGWNDWTNNIVGLQNQLIPGFEATNDDQKNYVLNIKSWSKQSSSCIGFCYWGGEWISFRGAQATDGSSWENQALWDFNNNALPVIGAFNEN